MNSTAEVRLEWGHALAIWDTGRVIRVPQFIFPLLRQVGLLIGGKAILSPLAPQMIKDRRLDPIMFEIRRVLGEDLTGPESCQCHCRACSKRESQIEDSRLSRVRAEQIVREVQGGTAAA